ncbi:MAG: nucleoside-diphosphate kinase [Pelagibacterales bacterium]|nr:nucleoside-diphosphate kinase [Pelagibacterales bacterium]|tara:strand:- start:6684 stop:7094 length:411 start_codon:yes stop_codon:yes gene_type:complete
MTIEQTLSMIKPDAVERNIIGAIINFLEENNLKVLDIKVLQLTDKQAKKFYDIHKGKPFFESLIKNITSNKVVAMVLEGDNAVDKYRELMGATDPKDACNGTIRKMFAIDGQKNSVHGSDSLENAAKEIKFFFNSQ